MGETESQDPLDMLYSSLSVISRFTFNRPARYVTFCFNDRYAVSVQILPDTIEQVTSPFDAQRIAFELYKLASVEYLSAIFGAPSNNQHWYGRLVPHAKDCTR